MARPPEARGSRCPALWRGPLLRAGLLAAAFLGLFFLPLGAEGPADSGRLAAALLEALRLAQWYAREHVVLCLVPAFFLAGAIAVFLRRQSVMRTLGARAPKVLAYGVASVAGSVLAVCSCTVLPLFAGIWRMGAGLGPATTFLYSGPAINVMAMVLTARVLGPELGVARAVGAVGLSVVIGLAMHAIYRREEYARAAAPAADDPATDDDGSLWRKAALLAVLVGVLVFATWGPPAAGDGVAAMIWRQKWLATAALTGLLGLMLVAWLKVKAWKVALAAVPAAVLAATLPSRGLWVLLPFAAGAAGLAAALASSPGRGRQWLEATWEFAGRILPLLLLGVLAAGLLLGRPGHEGLIPGRWVALLVGDSPGPFLAAAGGDEGPWAAAVRAFWPLWTNFFAAVFGAFMYFATLTEVPILQGLVGAGMGKGPALALLLAGPALSLPNMLVIAGVLGARKTAVFVALVVVLSTVAGMAYGALL